MLRSSRVSVGADLHDSIDEALRSADSDAASRPIRVLIVDDHKMLAEGIAALDAIARSIMRTNSGCPT
jgi:hypothetical protein